MTVASTGAPKCIRYSRQAAVGEKCILKRTEDHACVCTWQVLKAQRRKSSHRSFLCREGLHVPQAHVKQGGEQSRSRALQAGMDVFVA